MTTLIISGACGRMGQRLITLGHQDESLTITGALEYAACEHIGKDIGVVAGIGPIDVTVAAELTEPADVMIDFSTPGGTIQRLEQCIEHNTALVIGTTGLDETQRATIKDAGAKIPVLFGANMSLGVNLLFKLVGQVAAALSDDYDIEIVEAHHRFKKDAPSGTALELARSIASAKNWPFESCLEHGRSGTDALRNEKTIGMHAVRVGDTVGEHSVMFGALGETIEIKHSAHTRDTFVRGALHAASWLAGKPAGYYSMADVLGL